MAKPIEIPLVVDASQFAQGLGRAVSQVESAAKKMAAATGGDVDEIKKKLLELDQVKLATKAAKIDIDTATAKKELAALSTYANEELRKTGEKLSSVGSSMSRNITLPVVAAFGVSAKAASDLGESVNKVDVIFKGAAGTVQTFASDAAKNLGLSQRAALDFAGGFGSFTKQLGDSQTSAKASIELTQRAVDLASLFNTSTSEAAQKLASGLAGEAEPLRQFGILISEAKVKAEAYASGIARSGTELTESQKVQARYNIILRESQIAQGDYSRTSDSTANTLRRLKAEAEDASVIIGNRIAPATRLATGAAESFIQAFVKAPPALQATAVGVAGVAAAIGPMLSTVGNAARGISAMSEAAAKFRDAEGNLTRTGTALAGLGIATGVAVGVGALVSVLKQIEQSQVAEKIKQINAVVADLGKNVAKVDLARLNKDLADFAKNDDIFSKIFGNDTSGDAVRRIGTLRQAFDELRKSGDTTTIEAYLKKLEEGGKVSKNLAVFIADARAENERWIETQARARNGVAATTKAVDEKAAALRGDTAAIEDNTKAVEAAAKAEESRVKAVLGLAGAHASASDAVKALTDHTKEQAEAAERATKTDELAAKVSRDSKAIRDAEAQGRRDVAAAIAAEETAKKRVAEADKAVEKATGDLARAEGDARRAGIQAAQAAYDYGRTLTGLGEHADATKSALLAMNDAKLGVSSAEIGVRGAERALADAQKRRAADLDQNEIERQRRLILLRMQDAQTGVTRAEQNLARVKTDGKSSTQDVIDAERDLERTRLEAQGTLRDLQADLDNLANSSSNQQQLDDDVRRAEIDLERARQSLAQQTAEAAEKQRIYNGDLNGFTEDSPEAIAAHDKLTKAVDDQSKAEQTVIDKQDAVAQAQDARRKAAQDVADAHKDIAVKAQSAKEKVADLVGQMRADQADLVKYKNETAKLASANKDVGTEVSNAITQLANFYSKLAESQGKPISDVEAIKKAVTDLKDEIHLTGKELEALTEIDTAVSGGSSSTAPSYSSRQGSLAAGAAVSKVIAEARAHLGDSESNGRAGAFLNRAVVGEANAWCQAFVNKIFKDANVALPNAGSDSTRNSFQSLVKAGLKSAEPVIGGLAYATRAGVNKGHVGIVVGYDPKTGMVTTIEGNSTGDAVAQHTQKLSAWDLGFINPYANGTRKFATGDGPDNMVPGLKDIFANDPSLKKTAEATEDTADSAEHTAMAAEATRDGIRWLIDKGFSADDATQRWQQAMTAALGNEIVALGMIQASTANAAASTAALTLLQASAINTAVATATANTTFTGGPDGMTIRLYAMDPSTRGTLFDGAGNPIYADDREAVQREIERRAREGIPFARGGFVPYRAGGTQIKGIFGESDPRGEIISPVTVMASTMQDVLARQQAAGGGGTNIYVTVQAGLVSTPSEIARQIVDVVDPYLHQQGRYATGVLARPA